MAAISASEDVVDFRITCCEAARLSRMKCFRWTGLKWEEEAVRYSVRRDVVGAGVSSSSILLLRVLEMTMLLLLLVAPSARSPGHSSLELEYSSLPSLLLPMMALLQPRYRSPLSLRPLSCSSLPLPSPAL